MGILIKIENIDNKTYTQYFKTIHKNIDYVPRGFEIKKCGITTELKTRKDIHTLQQFLKTLEVGMISKK